MERRASCCRRRSFGDRPPEVTVENGVIEIFDPLKNPASTLTLRDVNLTLSPPAPNAPAPAVANGTRRLQGTLAGDGFRRVEFEGWSIVQRGHSVRSAARPKGSRSRPSCAIPCPTRWRRSFWPLGDLRGQGDLRFELSYDPAAAAAADRYRRSSGHGLSRAGGSTTRGCPHALTDIRATVHVNNGGYAIDDLTARSGQATLRMSCRRLGLRADQPAVADGRGPPVGAGPRAAGHPAASRCKSSGTSIGPPARSTPTCSSPSTAKTWRPEVAVRCLNVSFTHHKFPYRLEHGKGTLDLKDDRLKVEPDGLQREPAGAI